MMQNQRMRAWLIAPVVLMMAAASVAPGTARQQSDVALAMPANAGSRVPAAIVLNNAALADGLRADGVATANVASDIPAAVAAITQLRNDPRASTITVIGPGAVAGPVATTARADGVWATSGGLAGFQSSVIASLAASTAPDARAIAAWIRDLKPVRHPLTQRASLRDTTVAELDGGRVTIEYGRPSKRNRNIWGALVPWGKWWMPGADEATVITNAKPMHIGSLAVPAGEHTLYTMPGEDQFMLIVNNAVGQFHTEYFPARDLGRVVMAKGPRSEPMERMAFELVATPAGASLKLAWDDREYVVVLTAG